MNKSEVQVGMRVFFGRSHGEQTLGEVVKVNRAKVKVRQLAARGSLKSYPIGTYWSLPATFLVPASEEATANAAHPAPDPALKPLTVELSEGGGPNAEPTPNQPKAKPARRTRTTVKAKAHKGTTTKVKGRPTTRTRVDHPEERAPVLMDLRSGFRLVGKRGESVRDFYNRLGELLDPTHHHMAPTTNGVNGTTTAAAHDIH